jgi:hypothetical protein
MLDGAGGLKPCLSAWKSAKADSIISPRRGFHELSRRLQPRESRESWLAEQLLFSVIQKTGLTVEVKPVFLML